MYNNIILNHLIWKMHLVAIVLFEQIYCRELSLINERNKSLIHIDKDSRQSIAWALKKCKN